MGNQININCKGHQKCYNLLLEEVTQGKLSCTALIALMFLQKERYDQNKRNEGTFTCDYTKLGNMMGTRNNRLAPMVIRELISKGYVKKIGKRGRKTLYELPELIENKADTEIVKADSKKETPKETEHNQLNHNDMGNYIGTLEDFGLQGTEPVITYTNGEQEEKVMDNQVIPKQETIVKEEPKPEDIKPDEPPTVDELLAPYKEYLDKKIPLGETPKDIQDDAMKRRMVNLYNYRVKGLKESEKKEYEKLISSHHHLK